MPKEPPNSATGAVQLRQALAGCTGAKRRRKLHMFKTSLLFCCAAGLLFALPSSAADLSYTDEAPQMVCDDDGNCYRAHAPHFVERWQDDDDDDVYERSDYRPRYGAPRIGFHRDFDDGPATGVDVDGDTW
jgi:hypothetical protein